MQVSSVLAAVCVFTWGIPLFAQVGASTAKELATPNGAPAIIERLIEQLAATKPEPKKGSHEWGEREDHIWKAVDALTASGIQAFPGLIAHFDDARYCCGEDSLTTDDVYHHTVGDVCFEIVCASNVQVRVLGTTRPT